MAFGARNEGGWRLCHRKGKTIKTVLAGKYEVVFKSQAKAKACADELNDLFWKPYWKAESKDANTTPEIFWAMVETIQLHDGLSAGVVQEMRDTA